MRIDRAGAARVALGLAALAGLYMGLSQAGFSWFKTDAGPTFFPPAGLTLAAMVLLGWRFWPLVAAAAAAGEIGIDLVNHLPLGASLGYACANAAEPLLGAAVVERLGGGPDLGERRRLVAFLLGGVAAGPLAGAAIGATASVLAGDEGLQWAATFGRWWMGDALGVLVVGGALIAWLSPTLRERTRPREHVEAALLVAACILALSWVFWKREWLLAYLPLVVLLVVALRLGVRWVALAGAAMAFMIAAQATLASHDLWDALNVGRTIGLAHLQLLIALVIVTALFLAVEVAERERASAARASAEQAREAAAAEAVREQEARDRLELLQRVSLALAAAGTVEEVLGALHAEGLAGLGAGASSLGIVDEGDPGAVRVTRTGFPQHSAEPYETLSLDAALPGPATLRDARPRFFETRRQLESAFPEALGLLAGTPFVAVAYLPVQEGERVFAYLAAHFDGERRFSAEDRTLLRTLASLAGQALARAALFEEERRARLRLEALHELSGALAAEGELDGVRATVAGSAHRAVGAAVAILGTVDETGTTILFRAGGEPDALLAACRPEVALSEPTPATHAVRTGLPVVLDALDDCRRAYPDVAARLARTGVETIAWVPLRTRQGTVGVLGFRWTRRAAVDAATRGTITLIADLCAHALERALRLRGEELARRRAELVATILTELEAADGFAGRARRLAELLVPRVADYALIEAPDTPDPVVALAHRDPAMLPVLRALRERHRLPAEDLRSVARVADGSDQLIGRITPEVLREHAPDAEALALLERLGPHSHLAVSLSVVGERPGGLVLVLGLSDPARRPYEQRDLAFVKELAARAALAIESARLLDEEHATAARLQEALLPEAPVAHAAASLVARYRPGDERLQVGGDWYETVALPDGRIALAVGDVVGHGLPAAAAMGRMRTAFAALAPRHRAPAELLDQLDLFAQTVEAAHYSTACCAILDPETGELRYASAGHPPLLLVTADGTAGFLEGGRSWPLCSPVDEAERADARVVLPPGSTLLLYSDGLIERREESLAAGLERLAAAARARARLPAEALCDGIVAELTAGRPLQDDLVLLAVRLDRVAPVSFGRRIPACPEELAPLRAGLRAWMEATGVREEDRYALLLAVGEACANAIEHAYGAPGRGELEVSITRRGDEALLVTVRDFGRWKDPVADPDRGRGTPLMKELADEVLRHTDEEGTTVTLRFGLAEPALSATP